MSAGKARLLGRCEALVHQFCELLGCFHRCSGAAELKLLLLSRRITRGSMYSRGDEADRKSSVKEARTAASIPIEFPMAPLPLYGGKGPFLFTAGKTAETAARVR